MSDKIFTSWTINGEPSQWSATLAYSAISAVLPITSRISLQRHTGVVTEVTILVFAVLVGDHEIPCTREIHDGEPIEKQRRRIAEFRAEVIKAWAETL